MGTDYICRYIGFRYSCRVNHFDKLIIRKASSFHFFARRISFARSSHLVVGNSLFTIHIARVRAALLLGGGAARAFALRCIHLRFRIRIRTSDVRPPDHTSTHTRIFITYASSNK